MDCIGAVPRMKREVAMEGRLGAWPARGLWPSAAVDADAEQRRRSLRPRAAPRRRAHPPRLDPTKVVARQQSPIRSTCCRRRGDEIKLSDELSTHTLVATPRRRPKVRLSLRWRARARRPPALPHRGRPLRSIRCSPAPGRRGPDVARSACPAAERQDGLGARRDAQLVLGRAHAARRRSWRAARDALHAGRKIWWARVGIGTGHADPVRALLDPRSPKAASASPAYGP